ncbi:MAG: EVE domain-containing protein [Deltaproteobacteria bacterium]|nr:EVE domain-containing protein [Deltaproteobacteria bacterium]
MAKWLVKSEVEDYSIDDLAADKRTLWTGVRNYLARNYLREMAPGDEVFYYHSNAQPPGIAGVAKVTKRAVPDPTQFDKLSDYYEKRATQENPVWSSPEIAFVKKFPRLISRAELLDDARFEGMMILQVGSRLSVTPVSDTHFNSVLKLASGAAVEIAKTPRRRNQVSRKSASRSAPNR